jgi:hypothetical protein
MELDDEEKMDAAMPIAMPDKPDYPYGLRISLTHKELKKLGLDPDCEVGDMLDMRCFAVVRSVSLNDSDNGQTCCIELQIEKMAVEDEMNESED